MSEKTLSEKAVREKALSEKGASVVTRFAPSPTGDLHLGHVYAAAFARDAAAAAGGRYLVRIEDIDHTRCRAQFAARNLADLHWLGLAGEAEPVRQSERLDLYRTALARLEGLGVVYPCFCTRAEIRAEIAAAAAAPHAGPDGAPAYPGTCRRLDVGERADRLAAGRPHALRLDAAAAARMTGPLDWSDRRFGPHTVDPATIGDVVLARKDLGTSYHVAVVVDDAAQGVTLVTRGEDLLASTPIHRMLYALLGLAAPQWHHHPLVRDAAGERLAKRADAASVRALRQAGRSAEAVLVMAGTAAPRGRSGR